MNGLHSFYYIVHPLESLYVHDMLDHMIIVVAYMQSLIDDTSHSKTITYTQVLYP